MIRNCPRCSTQWPEDLRKCPHDGALLSEPEAEPQDADGGLDLLETYGCRPGDVLGQYRLVRLIGLGGMAAVFEAEHNVLSRPVALKVLHREVHDSAEDIRRFFHEARAITELAHPGIVECLDFVDGTDDSPPYLVMELVRGETLAQVIKERAPLPLSEAVSITRQICDAMTVVHDQGILHRDLKPANIMVLEPEPGDDTPRVKLLDFGVAKFLVTEEHFLRTATGAVLGTPEYMAPEVVRGQKLSPPTDVYALGGVFYQLLTGRLPFVCDSLGQLINHHLRIPAQSPSEVAPPSHAKAISTGMDKVVLGCLSKAPEHRISSMSELRTRINRVMDGDDTDVVVIAPDHRSAPPPTQRPRWLVPTVGLVAAAMLVLGLWWVLRAPTRHAPSPAQQPQAKQRTAPAPDSGAVQSRPATPPPQAQQTRLVTRPTGAAVFRAEGGHYLGKTPMVVTLPQTGELRVILRLAGHRDTSFLVHRWSRDPLVATLSPRPGPQVRPTGAPTAGSMGRVRPMPGTMSAMAVMGMDVKWGTVDPFQKKP